jgi:8-amino-7-oxononanoate synthase
MHALDRIAFRIEALKAAGQWRDPMATAPARTSPGVSWIDARSNDYLGLAGSGVSRETVPVARVGSGASRLISGTHAEHLELERTLANWLQSEASLLFSSGYAANVGVMSALAGPGETILSDALNHASIIDGCRLSRANVVVLPHRDVDALSRALANTSGVRWVVTESYFSMDGDSPDLEALRRVCTRAEAALVVDEAHALGVFGPDGRGLCAQVGVQPDVLVGGLGKAIGAHGGFAACSELLRGWLWNRARSFVFSTAPGPLATALALKHLTRARSAHSERARLDAIGGRVARALGEAGVVMPAERHGPLFPIVFGSEAAAVAAADVAAQFGVQCQPIRPPTVPAGASRLRVTLRADMTDEEVERVTAALLAAWARHGGSAGGAGCAADDSVSRETDPACPVPLRGGGAGAAARDRRPGLEESGDPEGRGSGG